jgi:hypothetical protein
MAQLDIVHVNLWLLHFGPTRQMTELVNPQDLRGRLLGYGYFVRVSPLRLRSGHLFQFD